MLGRVPGLCRHLLILWLLIIHLGISKDEDIKTGTWINIGLGACLIQPASYLYTTINLSHQRNTRLATARLVERCTQIYDGLATNIRELGALYGIGLRRRLWAASAGAGIGYVWLRETSQPGDVSTFGIPVEVQLSFIPSSFCGIGLYLFSDLNFKKIPLGLAFCLQLGKLR